MELKEKLVEGLDDEEIELLASLQGVDEVFDDIKSSIKAYSTMMNVVKESNSEFKNKTLKQLNDDVKFQQALKEYIGENPLQNELLPKIIALISNKVRDYIIPNTKIANLLPSGKLYNKKTDVVVSGQTSKNKEITTTVILSYDKDKVTLRGQYEITAYDRIVHNAIVSLKKAGNKHFTPTMVYRTMNGLTESEKIRATTLEKIVESINKLSATRAVIDFTKEAKMYRKNVDKFEVGGYLIEVRDIKAKAGGEVINGYEFISEKDPILYEHAKISGQIYTVDVNLLQTKNKVRGTEDVIIIREYLIRQIEWIKSEKSNRSNNITYQGVYEEIGITDLQGQAFKDKSKAVRNHVKSILEAWQEQKYIKKYDEYREIKTLKGVIITV